MKLRTSLLPFVLAGVAACSGSSPRAATSGDLADLRKDGQSSSNGDLVGRWALAEMLAPGGDALWAKKARQRLDDSKNDDDGGKGMYAPLARALYDETHGHPAAAAGSYVTTLRTAAKSDDPDAPLVAWFAAHHLLALRNNVTHLHDTHAKALDDLLRAPGNIGWRAISELSEWGVAEAERKQGSQPTNLATDAEVAKELGCTRQVRLAGPFGHASAADRRRSFAAEAPGPWPAMWKPEPERADEPHVLSTEGRRCLVTSGESTDAGVFYVETGFDLREPRDLLLAVQSSVAVFVDDVEVGNRDLREWGVWQHFGVAVHLAAGRHRLVARLLADETSVRILALDGRPSGVTTDTDDTRPYVHEAPTVLADPNALGRFVRARRAETPLLATLSGYLAHAEAMDDVATVLMEPYTKPKDAAAVALQLDAEFVRGDPAFPAEVRAQEERAIETRAQAADPSLWYPAVWLAVDDAAQRGPLEAVEPLKKLRAASPEEPEIAEELAKVYGQLEWKAERVTTLRELVDRFPEDLGALREYLTVLDQDGPQADADRIAARIESLDPDSDLVLDRAVARRDWPGAVAELHRMAARHPERKTTALRMADVLGRAGDRQAALASWSEALAKTPDDAALRLRLADLAYSEGDVTALRKSLAAAIQQGAPSGELREALDLAEGATDLEPYRVDGRKVIAEFDAWQKAHPEKAQKGALGNAVRILDYSAVWVHPDGSSEMLEHEIQRMQSEEAVGQESEQQPPAGTVLHLRVIKPDGSVLEPEPVAGKPTLTMPHLEVGDCIEMEHVIRQPGDGEKGKKYVGPTWFFREADKGYWRSEFVVVTPKGKPLAVETRGHVPAPTVKDLGVLEERRWRVDDSPPAPDEPESVPVTEFLPSVRVGWGITLDDQVKRLLDVAVDETPLDPRLTAIARDITSGARTDDERARKVYEWIRTNVRDGEETDGRRVVTGKTGARQAAFEHLMRQLGIPVDVAIAKNRLALPPIGPMSDVDSYDSLLLRVRERGNATNGKVAPTTDRWLTVADRFSPFGYVPAEVRGTEAILLVPGTPRVRLPADGSSDGITFEGRADLRPDGGAHVELTERFVGKIGGTLREVLEKISAGQLDNFVESRLLSRNFPDASLTKVTIEGRDQLDQPLLVHCVLEVPSLARPVANGRLALRPLFPAHLTSFATLPSRETPLLLGSASRMETHFTIVVPQSMRLPASLEPVDLTDADRQAHVHDRVLGHALLLDRVVDMPAGRVMPGADYAAFQRFTSTADAALEREIVVGQ